MENEEKWENYLLENYINEDEKTEQEKIDEKWAFLEDWEE